MSLPKVKYSTSKHYPNTNKQDALIAFLWENRKLPESKLARSAIERFDQVAPKTIVSKIKHKKELFERAGLYEAPQPTLTKAFDSNTRHQIGAGVRQDAVPDIAEILIVIKNDLAVLKIQLEELINIQNQTLDLFKTINQKNREVR